MYNIFHFLSELKANNNRDWFNENKSFYLNAKAEVELFGQSLCMQMATIDSLDIENVKIFRIYRDVRFSKNKEPYKIHWGGSFSRLDHLRGGYYFHLEPNNNFIACGFWNPSKEDLLHLRKQIDIDGDQLLHVLENSTLKNNFQLIGEQVKTKPKGFSLNAPYIQLLRYKQFILTKHFKEDEVLSKDFIESITQSFQIARPFLDVMTSFLNTDLNGNKLSFL